MSSLAGLRTAEATEENIEKLNVRMRMLIVLPPIHHSATLYNELNLKQLSGEDIAIIL